MAELLINLCSVSEAHRGRCWPVPVLVDVTVFSTFISVAWRFVLIVFFCFISSRHYSFRVGEISRYHVNVMFACKL